MKRLPALFLLLLLTGCAMTPEQLRVAYHGANAMDAGTTAYGIEHGCNEANPMLGQSPSTGTVVAFAAVQSALYELIYWALKDRDESERLAFGRAFLVVKGLGVGWNAGQIAKGC